MSNQTESSSPKEATHLFRSSPPALTQDLLFEMDDSAASKSEPVASQDVQQTPRRPKHKRVGSDDTERPASAQRIHDDSEEQSDIEAQQESSDDENVDPAAQIANFDWEELHKRYHDEIDRCSEEEIKLSDEWESLMKFFEIWTQSGHNHETNRTFHRLQTRTTFVQHKEEEFEKTRNHYINVVKAFESALELLKAPGLRG